MRAFVDFPTREDFVQAFRSEPAAIFVRTRPGLPDPDASLATLLDQHRDVLVVGPFAAWRARVECDHRGKPEIFGIVPRDVVEQAVTRSPARAHFKMSAVAGGRAGVAAGLTTTPAINRLRTPVQKPRPRAAARDGRDRGRTTD